MADAGEPSAAASAAAVPIAEITADEIDVAAVESAVWTKADGAVVAFRGVVRDHDGGRGVSALEYQAHPEAERFLRDACQAIADEHGVRVAAVHRTGRLDIGDVALAAAVASPHRAEAFAACSALIDQIKSTVPIWKRQQLADGETEWVGL